MRLSHAGYSLIEVVIALFLFSLVLVNVIQQQGIVRLALQNTYFTFVAIQHALSIADLLHVNEGVFWSQAISEWQKETAAILPQGKGTVNVIHEKIQVSTCWKLKTKQCVKVILPI